MASINVDLSDDLKNNDRYFVSFFSILVLSLLLVFFKDLNIWMQETLVPTLIVYLIGTVLIAQIQNMVGNRTMLKEGADFKGTHPMFFWIIVALHSIWFFLFSLYLLMTKLA